MLFRSRDRIAHPRVPDCTTSRRILADNLLELVHHTIKTVAEYSKINKAAFEKSIRDMLATQQTAEVKAQQKRLAVCKTRHGELEQLLNKIYEDICCKGRMSDSSKTAKGGGFIRSSMKRHSRRGAIHICTQQER